MRKIVNLQKPTLGYPKPETSGNQGNRNNPSLEMIQQRLFTVNLLDLLETFEGNFRTICFRIESSGGSGRMESALSVIVQ